MVKSLSLIKSKYFSKRELVLAITAFVVAFLFSANFVFAAKTKMNTQEAERIKTALGIVNTASNFGSVLLDGGGLMKVLNTAIKGGQTATDITYGLLVLSAINEMEFIDLVISQEYKTLQREYFEQILKERTKLTSYWKGVGFDIPKVVSGNITGPIGALTLNTFEMTDKIVLIFTELEVLKKGRQYDGLYYYFDFRRGGDSHAEAWELVEEQMGWAVRLTGFRMGREKETHQLESQFASLYEKWAPHATPFGISKEYKEQLASELRTTLAIAIEENTGVAPLYAEKPSLWDKVLVQLENIKNAVANLVSQANPFGAGPVVELPAEIPADNGSPQAEEVADVGFPLVSEPEPTNEAQEDLDDILEEADVELAEESFSLAEPELEPEPEPELLPEPELELLSEPAPEPSAEIENIMGVQHPLFEPCQRGDTGAARQYRVLINEVAWMGDQDSPDNEWIELKNIWGLPINLFGWQVQDKDQQIKVIFKENDAIPAGGYLLLERGKDYTGALNNTNEAIYLFDDSCQLEDEVLAMPDWPGGDNYSKKTMQRFDVLKWYSGPVTASDENSPPPTIFVHPSAPAPAPAVSKPTYLKLLITESRTRSPGEEKDDFVELYNPNAEAVSLTDWYIQRKTATGQNFSSYVPASLFSGQTIGAKNYFVVANTSSSLSAELIGVSTTYPLTENNTLALKNPDQEIVDQVSTGDPPPSKSYGRQWSSSTLSYIDTFGNQTPTPRAQNSGSEDDEGEEDDDDETDDEPFAVVFNEIAWAGTKANSSDEWMELFNFGNSNVDLTGWKIKKDEEDWIAFSTSTILAQGYFLLERTDDNTIKDIPANQFFTGSLNNGGEKLELIDANGNTIDTVDASLSWPAGIASPGYVSMERVNATSSIWVSNNRITRNGADSANNPINGTPKSQNSVSGPFTQIPNSFTITEDAVLTYFGSPYFVAGYMTVSGAKLTVEPGVVLKFKSTGVANQNSLLKVENGVLEAIGTADQKITLTSSSTQPQAGDWDGLYLKNSIFTLNNAVIQYGGRLHKPCCYEWAPYTYGSVYIEGGNVQISNSLIEKSGTFSLWLKNSDASQIIGTEFRDNLGADHNGKSAAVLIENSNPTIKDSIFRNNKIGILAENYSAPTIKDNQFIQNTIPIQITSLLTDIGDNTFENNGDNGVLVSSFGFSESAQEIKWEKTNAPYFIENAFTIPSGYTLEIKPGVEIRLRGRGQINVDGTLEAKGTAQNKIIFTGASEVPGAWRYVKFSASSADSVLSHVIVSYGGFVGSFGSGAPNRGAITIEDALVEISDSLIENNYFAGLHLINSDSAVRDTIFRNNRVQYSLWGAGSYSRGLYLNNSQPELAGSSFEKNYHGIYVEGSCPDLTGVVFGSGDSANSINVYPSNCAP